MTIWSNDKIRELTELSRAGLTSGQIAEKCGLTRGAVTGKRSRLGIRLSSRPSNPTWNSDRIRELTELSRAGLTARQIAQKCGVTRNAVIGKLYRLGIRLSRSNSNPARLHAGSAAPLGHHSSLMPGGAATISATSTAHSHNKRNGDAFKTLHRIKRNLEEEGRLPFMGGVTDLPDLPDERQRCTLMDLTEVRCRWPYGDPRSPDFLYCGSTSPAGVPYCEYHMRIAYEKQSHPVSTWRIWW